MHKELIDRYIALPMAINVMKQDREKFKKFKMAPVYKRLMDPVIEKASSDFYELKKDIIGKHHLDIKKLDGLRYTVNGKIVEYTTEELKELTNDIMKHFISTVEIEWEEWE